MYTDSSGVDLEQFIRETLQTCKNRAFLLQVEKEILELINDPENTEFKFGAMNTYHRMLVHRVAAFFGLDHNVEKSSDCVHVKKTKNTRIPDMKFEDVPLKKEKETDVFAEPKKVLKRNDEGSSSFEKSPDRRGIVKKSQSYEERKQNYEQSRARIFASQGASSSSEAADHSLNAASENNDPSTTPTANSSLISSQDDVSPGDKPWSSLESDSSSNHRVQRQSRVETRSLDHEGKTSKYLSPTYVPSGREKLKPGVKSSSFGGTSQTSYVASPQNPASASGKLVKANSLNGPNPDSRIRPHQGSVGVKSWGHESTTHGPSHRPSQNRPEAAACHSAGRPQGTPRRQHHFQQNVHHNAPHQYSGQWSSSDRSPKFLLYNPTMSKSPLVSEIVVSIFVPTDATYPARDHQLSNYHQEPPQQMILHHVANLLQSADQSVSKLSFP